MRRERLVKTLQVRVTAKQARHLEAQARDRGVSIGVIVREMVRESQARRDATGPANVNVASIAA